jgi:hypothetical protein
MKLVKLLMVVGFVLRKFGSAYPLSALELSHSNCYTELLAPLN